MVLPMAPLKTTTPPIFATAGLDVLNRPPTHPFSNVISVTVGQHPSVGHGTDFSTPYDLQANGSATFGPVVNPLGIFAGNQDIGPGGDPAQAGTSDFVPGTGTTISIRAPSVPRGVSSHHR